jgi:hypothetical protein
MINIVDKQQTPQTQRWPGWKEPGSITMQQWPYSIKQKLTPSRAPAYTSSRPFILLQRRGAGHY